MSNTFTKILIPSIFCVLTTIIIFTGNFSRNITRKNWLSTFDNLLLQFNVETHKRALYVRNFFFPDQAAFQTYKRLLQRDQNLETTVDCIGSFNNQSCLFKNLYYYERTFWILTTKKITYSLLNIRIGAWIPSKLTPNRRRFYSYSDLDQFVRRELNPIVIPNLTLYFDQPWLSNIGHALFDGLYPTYVALIRFPPRHLQPFRIMLSTFNDHRDSSLSQEVYHRFAGLGILNATSVEDMSDRASFTFEEIVIGSGSLCQRCLQPNLQLPGGVELNGSQLFRDRMYKSYGFKDSPTRQNHHSVERRDMKKPLKAYIIDNKRFTSEDRKEINVAIEIINQYTNTHRHQLTESGIKLDWPLVQVSYIRYPSIAIQNDGSLQLNATDVESKMLVPSSKMMAHLQLLQDINIHVTGPGTGQMYQTFLSDGSVSINLGGLAYKKHNTTVQKYTSFMEQYMTGGTPYIKGLYYPINERTKGIKREIVIQLIREAAQLILDGFSIPVNPEKNLAADGKLFIEMCYLDKSFCKTVTERWQQSHNWCIDTWPEDIIHEKGPWSLQGLHNDDGTNITCSYNRTLMHRLRLKYNIDFMSQSFEQNKND